LQDRVRSPLVRTLTFLCYSSVRRGHCRDVPAGLLGCNCSLVDRPTSKRAIVRRSQRRLRAIDARLAALVRRSTRSCTRTRIDHVGATGRGATEEHARACIHEPGLLPHDSAFPSGSHPRPSLARNRREWKARSRMEERSAPGAFEMGVLHTPGTPQGASPSS